MSHRSIIVVDDDRLTRESLCEVFSDLGCDPTPTDRGDAALALLERLRRDLVVSDVDMPDMSGFELLHRMNRHHIDTPLVLMSARADAGLDRAAHENGAIALIPKPVQIGPFTTLVQNVLDL